MGCVFDRALKDSDIVDPVVSEVAIRRKKATRDPIAALLRSELPSSRQAQALAMAIVTHWTARPPLHTPFIWRRRGEHGMPHKF